MIDHGLFGPVERDRRDGRHTLENDLVDDALVVAVRLKA